MKRLSSILALLVIVALFVPAKALYDNYQQELGRRDAELALLRPKVVALEQQVRLISDSLKAKVKISYRTKIVWDTLPPLVPELQKPDAAPVPAATLARVILIGQEAIQSCHSALNTCETIIPLKDSIISLREKEVSILKKRVLGRWDAALQWSLRIGFFWLGTQVR